MHIDSFHEIVEMIKKEAKEINENIDPTVMLEEIAAAKIAQWRLIVDEG